MTVVTYYAKQFISEEVTRQGHEGEDHETRCEWMEEAWYYATLRRRHDREVPGLTDLLTVARLIEPVKNADGFRIVELKPFPSDIPPPAVYATRLTETLWSVLPEVMLYPGKRRVDIFGENSPTDPMTIDDWYVEFMRIHPFRDGNGRTGKVIYNWLLNTFDRPILVKDYFGGGVP